MIRSATHYAKSTGEGSLFRAISRASFFITVLTLIFLVIKFHLYAAAPGATEQTRSLSSPVSLLQSCISFLKYIASGIFGSNALAGDWLMVTWGLVFHFIIVFTFTGVCFLLFRRSQRLFRSAITFAFLYSIAVTILLNWLVLPLSKAAPVINQAENTLLDAFIALLAMSVPTVCMAAAHFKSPPFTSRSATAAKQPPRNSRDEGEQTQPA